MADNGSYINIFDIPGYTITIALDDINGDQASLKVSANGKVSDVILTLPEPEKTLSDFRSHVGDSDQGAVISFTNMLNTARNLADCEDLSAETLGKSEYARGLAEFLVDTFDMASFFGDGDTARDLVLAEMAKGL